MDVLTDFLQLAGVNVRLQGCVTVTDSSPVVNDCGDFHGIVYTTCQERIRVDRPPDEAIELLPGDALFLLRGTSSLINTDGGTAKVIVGRIEFTLGQIHSEAIALPAVLRLQTADDKGGLVDRLGEEVRAAQPGWKAVATALANALLVAAIRAYRMPESDCPSHSWLRGLSDPEIGEALRLMHERPAYPWTVARLADSLSISRSTFAARFKQLTGRPPLAYLTWWRLCRAAARLRRRDGATIAEVAREVGYETEAAFGKAFRRQFGRTPGQVRREATELRQKTPLQVELKKRHPFDVREQEVALNLLRSAAKLAADFVPLLAHHGVTGTKYNVLRILRGEGSPLPLAEVQSRLVVEDKQIGETMSSLTSAGLVETDGSGRLRVTSEGVLLLAKLDGPIVDAHRRQLAHFLPEELTELDRLLVKVRRPDQ